EEGHMPFVQVSMGSGRTPEQKRALLDGISEVVHTTLGADYDSIKVWIVALRDLELHFLDWGDRDAPPVLFLHGFAGHAWQTIFPAQVLADDHWVIAL